MRYLSVPSMARHERRHNHGMCPKCREDRRNGCICPEQHPEVQWTDCPVHGASRPSEPTE